MADNTKDAVKNQIKAKIIEALNSIENDKEKTDLLQEIISELKDIVNISSPNIGTQIFRQQLQVLIPIPSRNNRDYCRKDASSIVKETK